MTDTVDRLSTLIRASDGAAWGAENGALLTEALALAEAAGEEQYAYAVRMRLAINAHLIDDHELLLATFAVCEQQHTSDPVRFPANPAHMGRPGNGYQYSDLYWIWKWIPNVLMTSPAFSAEVVEESLRDLEAGFSRAGLPDKCVAQRRLTWAVERADVAAIGEWAQRVDMLPDDEHSDCAACSRSELIGAALALGDEPRALRLLGEIEDAGYDCAEEPAVAYSQLLDVLAAQPESHRLAAAVEHIVHSEGALGESTDAVARLVVFLARSGQAGRALTIARRTLHRIVAAPLDEGTHELILAATAVAVRAVLATSAQTTGGVGDAAIPEADEPGLQRYLGRAPAGHTVDSLGRAAEHAAWTIAARFDARNGTSAHAHRLTAMLDDRRYPGLHLRLPVDPDAAFTAEFAVAPPLFRVQDAVIAEPADGHQAVGAVTNLAQLGREADAIALGRRWLDRIDGPLDRAILLHRLAVAVNRVDPSADARALFDESMAALGHAGLCDLADAIGTLGAWAYCEVPHGEYPAVHAAISGLLRSGVDEATVGVALTFVIEAYATPAEAPGALDLLGATGPLVPRLADSAWSSKVAGARLYLAQGPDADPQAILRALAQFPGEVLDCEQVRTEHSRGIALGMLGDAEGAMNATLAAYVAVTRWGDAAHRASVVTSLALAAARNDRPTEVVAIAGFLEQVAGALAPEVAATSLLRVAHALTEVGLGSQAISPIERAVTLLEMTPSPNHGLLGLAYRHLGEAASGIAERRLAITHFTASTQAFEAASDPLQAAESALKAAAEELRLGNVMQAGQIAEAVAQSAGQLDDSWALRLGALHLMADAAARAGADLVADREVEAAYEAALECALDAHDPQAASTARLGVLESYARWLVRRDRCADAVPLSREAWQLARGGPSGEGYGEEALTLALALGGRGDALALEERQAVLAELLADPRTPQLIAEQARRLRPTTDPTTT